MVCKLRSCKRGIFQISRMRELTSQYLTKKETFLKKSIVHAHIHSHAHIYTYHFLTVGLPGKFGKLSGSVLLENKQKYFMVRLFLSCLTLLQFLLHIISRLSNLKRPLLSYSREYQAMLELVFSVYLFHSIVRN